MIKYLIFIFISYVFYIISTMLISKIVAEEVGNDPSKMNIKLFVYATFLAFSFFMTFLMLFYKFVIM